MKPRQRIALETIRFLISRVYVNDRQEIQHLIEVYAVTVNFALTVRFGQLR